MTRCHFSRPLARAVGFALALAPVAASAQGNRLAFELGGGLTYGPSYEGSDEYSSGPAVQGALHALTFGPLSIGGGDGLGFSVGPSFGFVGERNDDDYSILNGIPDVDWTLELGVKATYRMENAEFFAAVRHGVNGHEAVTGDIGANAILRPDALTTVRFGPRATFASDEYADTYFSVPTTATNLSPYAAEGGLKSIGAEVIVRRELTDTWAIQGKLGYERLQNDFADSPVTRAGSEHQTKVSVTLIRQFDWRF